MVRASQEELVTRLQDYQDKLAEAELQSSRRFDDVFANPPAGVAVHEFDLTGTIRRVNPEELRLLGYTPDQLVGHRIWEFVVMQDVSRDSVQKKLAGEKDIKPFVRTFRRGDGSGLAMLLVDRRLSNAQGEPLGIRTAMTPLAEVGEAAKP